MTRLSCNIYNTSLDRWSFTDDTSVMQYLQQFPRQMIVHRWHICHAIFTTLPSTDDRSQMTRLSCNIYNSSLDRWTFTDDTSVMQYLPQFPWQMIFHRWHVCHAICNTDGARFTHPWPSDIASQATSDILREQFPSQMNVHITDDTSIMEYLQQVAAGWGVLLRSTYMQATTEIQHSDQFPSQMIVHRWHVCHAIFTTAGGRLTRPPHSELHGVYKSPSQHDGAVP